VKDRFEAIYADNAWGRGSGEGSLPVHTQGYVATLEGFLRDHAISKVVDLGCGDWQFSRYLDWGGAEYHGFDMVDSVIEQNHVRYASPGVTFYSFDGDFERLPPADLLIAKDVLQHWSNDSVRRFLPTLKRYKYSIITNCVNPKGRTENRDIEDGEFRHLDIRLPPFEVAASELLRFTNRKPRFLPFLQRTRWCKRMLLVSK
jgi:SAM-dependent methyltransferase